MAINKLNSELLFKQCDPKQFNFDTTAEIEDLTDIIGQQRAIDAMRFGLGIRHKGYNVFSIGSAGIGKHTLSLRYTKEKALTEKVPPDYCYVHSFKEIYRPKVFKLPAGKACLLSKDMDKLIEELLNTIPSVFDGVEYNTQLQKIDDELIKLEKIALKDIHKAAREKQISVVKTSTEYTLVPLRDNESLSPAEFDNLSDEERAIIEKNIDDLKDQLREKLREAPQWDKQANEKITALNHKTAKNLLFHPIDTLRQKYQDYPVITEYLNEVEADITANFRWFIPIDGKKLTEPTSTLDASEYGYGNENNISSRYKINSFVTHDPKQGAPVIYEDQPNYNNLIGRVDHKSELGTLLTDFTLIRCGALHRANGGYLILDADKVLQEPFAWDGLKRALQSSEIRIESMGQATNLSSTISLQPEPIPLDIKIIMLGERYLFDELSLVDPEFNELFKVVADFDDRMDANADTYQLYARLIATIVRRENLKPLDTSAVSRIIEHSARLLEENDKLLIHSRSLADMLRESDYYADINSHDSINASDVQHAIDARIYRMNRIDKRLQDDIQQGSHLIDVHGNKTGQINALTVFQLGNFSFGLPSRITAVVRMGNTQIIDIEREVELGGPIHSKGVFILSGFLRAYYLPNSPLVLSASIAFEQSYGVVDGDSASLAELCALLSALADAPIKQSLAVTGSINQQGGVQSIGGINEKIEGFFEVCKTQGLTGEHGVIIPASNLKNLMLNNEVRSAVKENMFSIFSVEKVDDCMELLTGLTSGARKENGDFPDGTINQRIESTLKKYTHTMQDYYSNKNIELN